MGLNQQAASGGACPRQKTTTAYVAEGHWDGGAGGEGAKRHQDSQPRCVQISSPYGRFSETLWLRCWLRCHSSIHPVASLAAVNMASWIVERLIWIDFSGRLASATYRQQDRARIRRLGIRIAGSEGGVFSVILGVIECCLCLPWRADAPLPVETRSRRVVACLCAGAQGRGGSPMLNASAETPKRTEDRQGDRPLEWS